MISVIIAAKDSAKWIQKTLSSLKNQTFTDWECIISVNGSSDETLDICHEQNDSRFSVIYSDIPNKSLAVNRAIQQTKREWISILDADDLWHEDKLSIQSRAIDSKIDILGTQMRYIDEFDKTIVGAPQLPNKHEECIEQLLSNNNPIANSSVLYRKSIHDFVGFYDPELFGVEDYDMWKRCGRAGMKFLNLNEQLLFHRLHKNSNFNSANRQQHYKMLVDSVDDFHRNIRSVTNEVRR